jgi:hypothetical protein
MVRRTTKMLKKINKIDIKFDGKKKKFFTSSKRKPISEMDCYNCGELGHLAHQCPKPKKDKYKKKYKGKKDDSSDDNDEKKKNKSYKKKDGKKKEYQKKKKNDKAYIVGDWLTDIESSNGSSDGESECGSPINNRKALERKIDDRTSPVGTDQVQIKVRLV